MTAPCGLDCFNCPMYHAGSNDDLRKNIAESMKIDYELAACKGCRNENGTIGFIGLSEPCSVYRCTAEKGLHNCSECDEFPCDKLHPYADRANMVPHNTKVFNLCLIRKMGLQAWAVDKAASVKKTYFSGKFKL